MLSNNLAFKKNAPPLVAKMGTLDLYKLQRWFKIYEVPDFIRNKGWRIMLCGIFCPHPRVECLSFKFKNQMALLYKYIYMLYFKFLGHKSFLQRYMMVFLLLH